MTGARIEMGLLSPQPVYEKILGVPRPTCGSGYPQFRCRSIPALPLVATERLRRCPVCGREVLPEGYLIARLFNRSDTKKHVMIMGCTNCMKG